MGKSPANRESFLSVLKRPNLYSFYLVFLLWAFCTLLYYFGELADFFGWEALHWSFFYGVHDVHRLLFLAPILYAACIFGIKAAVIITIVATMTFLPRAVFISPFPDPLLRTAFFIIIAGTMAYLTARVRSETERRSHLEARLVAERNRLLAILERMEDGVCIIAPDYQIRFTNPSMIRDFGEGIGGYCYRYFRESAQPCPEICKLPSVISGASEKWEYDRPDGRTYEVVASPFIDSDGTVCQLATFRDITQRKKAQPKPSAPTA